MTNPVRNHLQLPGFGCKVGDRMDGTSRHLCDEITRVLQEYRDGLQLEDTTLREIDAIVALVTQDGCALPGSRLAWESHHVEKWLSHSESDT